MKKGLQLLSLLALSTLLCGCPPETYKNTNALKELRANHYHFKKVSRAYAAGIHFLLPDALKNSFKQDIAYHDNSFMRSSPELGIYFSVDAFDDNETGTILESYAAGTDSLQAVHDFFMSTRLKTLSESDIDVSVTSRLSGKTDGLFSTVQEKIEYTYGEPMTFQIATIRHKQAFYVFQFICSNQLAAYLYIDFHRILQSAH